jgi:hypothetical protein
MRALQKSLVYGLWVILMISTIPFQVTGEEVPFLSEGDGLIGTMIDPEGEMFFFPDALSNFSGFTSPGSNPNIFCFDANPKTSFVRNEPVIFNVFWSDTVESDGNNVYKVTMAVQAGGSLKIFYQDTIDFDLTQPPGSPINFCSAVRTTVPPTAPSGTFPWGAQVIKLADNTKLQGQLSNITVQSPRR